MNNETDAPEEVAEETDTVNESDNNIETRIQNQFNEEKWTRISSKDVSISRFKLLEELLKEATEKNSLDDLRTAAKEQLQEYEPSVAGRYFLGMIALEKDNPEEIVYLKQLLDQFQEGSKWAVVEFLADKMLEVSENRTILRAKANALEKLGKNKELIPVLEKLARSDRKNPDISLKYADAIINEDLEKGIQFYKITAESYAKSLQFDKLKSVWNKLTELIPDDFTFYRKIERILSGHRQKEVLADLFVQLAYVFIKKEDTDNIIQLSKKILDLNPNYTRFKNELIRSYKEKYKDHSLLEDFVKYSGLLDSRKNISNSIQNFETNIVFDKDNYVFHRVWGVGKIKELDTEKMIIDFKDKPDHRMEIQMALKSLKPLQKDHFWVHQYEKPEELQEMFDNDFVSFFKILIASFGNSIALADIKAELADVYVPLKSWSKWWTKKRAELLKDNLIRVSPQRKDILELHQTAVTHSEMLIEKFQASQNYEERNVVAFEALKDVSDSTEAIEYMIPFYTEGLKSLDFEIRLQSLWILEFFHEALNDDDQYIPADKEKEIIETFQKTSIADLVKFNAGFKNTELKKKFAAFVKDHHQNWQKVYVELLLQTPIKIHKNLMADLISAGATSAIVEFFTRLRKTARDNAEVFMWALKNLLTGAWDIKEVPVSEQILSFFRLLRNLPKIEQKGTKLKNAARELIMGSVSEEMLAAIEAEAQGSVRKLSALFKDVSFFNDLEKQKFVSWMMKITPDAFDADEEIDEDKLETGNALIAQLEKDNVAVASQNAIAQMKEEMEHLVRVEMPKNSEEIGLAQEKGDLRENAEYKAALERQSILQAQVTRLEEQLKQVYEMSGNQVLVDSVGLGNKVKLKDVDTEDIFVYSILDQWDADVDKGIISYKSPLGKALLSTKVGDIASFGSGASEQKLEVLSIDKALDGEGNLI